MGYCRKKMQRCIEAKSIIPRAIFGGRALRGAAASPTLLHMARPPARLESEPEGSQTVRPSA